MSTFLRSLVRSEGKSCEGKLKFPREDSAQRSAADMIAKKAKQGKDEVFEHYKCSFCDGWHVGHRTNFNWIPNSHQHHRLMINHYKCSCEFEWFNSTAFSTRILTHFPGVQDEQERCILCPKCKNNVVYQGGLAPVPPIFWMGRKWVNLEEIDPESTATLQALWNSDVSVDKCPGL